MDSFSASSSSSSSSEVQLLPTQKEEKADQTEKSGNEEKQKHPDKQQIIEMLVTATVTFVTYQLESAKTLSLDMSELAGNELDKVKNLIQTLTILKDQKIELATTALESMKVYRLKLCHVEALALQFTITIVNLKYACHQVLDHTHSEDMHDDIIVALRQLLMSATDNFTDTIGRLLSVVSEIVEFATHVTSLFLDKLTIPKSMRPCGDWKLFEEAARTLQDKFINDNKALRCFLGRDVWLPEDVGRAKTQGDVMLAMLLVLCKKDKEEAEKSNLSKNRKRTRCDEDLKKEEEKLPVEEKQKHQVKRQRPDYIV
jgi:hypothetical protein